MYARAQEAITNQRVCMAHTKLDLEERLNKRRQKEQVLYIYERVNTCLCIYEYVYICIYIYTHIYIYVYTPNEISKSQQATSEGAGLVYI